MVKDLSPFVEQSFPASQSWGYEAGGDGGKQAQLRELAELVVEAALTPRLCHLSWSLFSPEKPMKHQQRIPISPWFYSCGESCELEDVSSPANGKR